MPLLHAMRSALAQPAAGHASQASIIKCWLILNVCRDYRSWLIWILSGSTKQTKTGQCDNPLGRMMALQDGVAGAKVPILASESKNGCWLQHGYFLFLHIFCFCPLSVPLVRKKGKGLWRGWRCQVHDERVIKTLLVLVLGSTQILALNQSINQLHWVSTCMLEY